MSKEDDLTLWERYKKTIFPLKKSKKQEGLALQKKIEIEIKPRSPQAPSLKGEKESGEKAFLEGSLHYNGKKKIRKTLEIESRVDLHGMTQAQASKTLVQFIHHSYSARKQNLLVITGKGLKRQEGKTEGGIIRRQLPSWLEGLDLRAYVRFYTNEHPFEGNTGAFYVRLRKNKDKL